jgi:hypothetical protein
MRAELGAAGFTVIEVHEHVVVPGTATPGEFWASFVKGGAPAVLLRRRMGEDKFPEFSRRIVARLEEMIGPAPFEIRLTATLGIGTRPAE